MLAVLIRFVNLFVEFCDLIGNFSEPLVHAIFEHVRVCTGEVVGRCGGGPKETYLYLAEVVRISSPTKSQWDNPRQSHGGVTDGN